MFSTEDIRELLQTFSPPKSQVGVLPTLITASSDQGLITLHHVQTEFELRVTEANERIALSSLGDDLDVAVEIILQLTLSQPELALLSNDSNEVIPKAERDEIHSKLREALSNSVISRSEFASQIKIHPKSLDRLLHNQGEQLVHYEDHVCTQAYDDKVSEEALDVITRMINNITTGDYTSRDFAEMPTSPPQWLILHHLKRLAELPEYVNKVFVREVPHGIRIQCKQAVAYNVTSIAQVMRLNNFTYADLQNVFSSNRGLYDTLEDAINAFRNSGEVKVIDSFALSRKWFSSLIDSKLQALHYSETGKIDVLEHFQERVQKPIPGRGDRKFPDSLFGQVQREAEQHIDEAIAQKPEWHYRRFGTIVLTDEQYNNERDTLIESVGSGAAAQWQQLRDGNQTELKFAFPECTGTTAMESAIHEALSRDKTIQKAAEEQFWMSVAELEAQNELDFATFWSDRVDLRVRIYNEGLASVEEQKLSDQLSDLLTTYVQKELVPDAISKARSQSLILSRKTKKNVQKLETTLPTSNANAAAILSTLDKFIKKQGIEPASSSSLENYRATMLQDMLRRMAKQQKSSDGPVLFLTLVVVLFAKHYPGIVYATGKYAPKLLKQLKTKLEPAQYEQVEKWKEAAKTGTLSKEDREEMREMAAL